MQPKGVAVVIDAAHQCMTTRGVHKPGVSMVTSRMLGVFRDNAATRREFLSIIAEEVERLNGVVTQFLDYSRPLKPDTSPGDVNEILQRTFKLLQGDVPEGISIDLDLGAGLPRVACEPEQLKQVFINLALNAFQAMPGGGRLTVTSRAVRDELSLWREAPRRAELVEVRFRDTGPGIPDDAQERIFVPFYTTKEKGTGLGLAISQRIVKAHQGTIGVRSPPGGGAEFIVALPGLKEGRAAEVADGQPPAAGLGDGGRAPLRGERSRPRRRKRPRA